jgi:protein O-GlcNAcase/histone acetyltransferase
MNTYVYAPKDDFKMRAAWRLPYDETELAALRGLLEQCEERGLAFVYTIAPCLDIYYSDPGELRTLQAKVGQLLQEGVSHFCILFDDIPSHLRPDDAERFDSLGAAQAYIGNELFSYVRKRAQGLFFFCPTEYCGRMATPSVSESRYLHDLGRCLHPDIDVFWTGPEIVSETVPMASIVQLQQVLGRKPLIWDNLHANDYDIRRIYLGPYSGRSSTLRTEVRGVMANPNNEFEVNYLPLRSLALYAQDENYEAHRVYEALLEAWLPQFTTYGSEPITLEELKLLVDVLYLPFTLGEQAECLLASARALLREEPQEWDEEVFNALAQTSEQMDRLFEKLTELKNRDLLYALYPYAWEVRHTLLYLADYLRWLKDGRPGGRFGRPVQLPNTYRGGFVAALERLMPLDDRGDVHDGRSWPTLSDQAL